MEQGKSAPEKAEKEVTLITPYINLNTILCMIIRKREENINEFKVKNWCFFYFNYHTCDAY